MQELRSKVRAIEPNERVELWMNRERPEVGGVPKRFENWPLKLGRQIDFAHCTVTKPKPYDVAPDIPCFENVIIHTSLQWSNPVERAPLPGKFPVVQQFLLMKRCPLQDVP